MGTFYEVEIHVQPWHSQNACHSLNNKVITYDHVLFIGFSLNSVETKKKHFRKSTLSVALTFCLISSLCRKKPREMAKSKPTYKPSAHERFLTVFAQFNPLPTNHDRGVTNTTRGHTFWQATPLSIARNTFMSIDVEVSKPMFPCLHETEIPSDQLWRNLCRSFTNINDNELIITYVVAPTFARPRWRHF